MFTKLEIGQQIETSVVAVSGDCIFLDLNAKSEGILDKAELCDENGICSVKPGDKVKVFFTGERNGEMYFTVEGRVEKEIKGGFEILLGTTRAFCPYSQMGFRDRKESGDYIGTVQTFLIQEYKENGKNIIVSNRAVLESAHEGEIERLSKKIEEGSIVEGKITALHDYGAFVDIGSFNALLPISEISVGRVKDINSVLSVGQIVRVKVIKTDWQHERVSVSMKSLIADPWENAAQKYHEGDKIDGIISKVMDYGFFVTLETGIDGLVHVSSLENVERNTNLKKVFKEGELFSVCVKEVDAEKKRISLVPASSAEQDKTAEKYLKNQDFDDTYNPFAALMKK